jgi:CDP-6-deoxy-D-xylo-4-hexulose-3-dehydrase
VQIAENEAALKEQLRQVAIKYYEIKHKDAKQKFILGERIPYAGRVFDEKEIINLLDASLDFWLTAGKYAEKFEKDFANFLGVKYCSLVNSGSSANFLALMALTSPLLGPARLQKGDEVITVAAGFPTTVAPIIQAGAIPVFIDVTFPYYNLDCTQLENALSPKTKAVMAAHTLGNPFNLQTVKDFCDRHHLWLLEDNCDALGSRYLYNGEWKYTGTIGHIGTSSFYPPHHLTMGEGGAVYTNDPLLRRIINSLRDWGRDCWCQPGCDDTCQQRFSKQYGELPYGYDHKYVYLHLGYNLKITDLQAAVGCAQLEKLPDFVQARTKNWLRLYNGLKSWDNWIILPEATPNSHPSWFGFLLSVRKNFLFTRNEIVNHLETKNIQTRMLFAGNLLKHPCFNEMREKGQGFRVVGELSNTDYIMNNSFWIGVYPGLTEEKIDYMIESVNSFLEEKIK